MSPAASLMRLAQYRGVALVSLAQRRGLVGGIALASVVKLACEILCLMPGHFRKWIWTMGLIVHRHRVSTMEPQQPLTTTASTFTACSKTFALKLPRASSMFACWPKGAGRWLQSIYG